MNATEQPPTPNQTRSLLIHLGGTARSSSKPDRVVSIARANLQRWGGAKRDDRYWIERRERPLEQPPARIALLLPERSQDATDLRQRTPFAGPLTPAMRRAASEARCELGGAAGAMRGADARAHAPASPRRPSDALHEHREAILAEAARLNLSNVRMFGSVARGDETA